jgi:anti-sigma B factor antagonist
MNESMQTPERIPSRCPLCGNELNPDTLPLAADSPCPHCGKPLWFVHRQVEHVAIVDFSPGRILKDGEFHVLREFLFAQSPMPKVILNLANCQYFSDTTLAGFILLYKRLTEAQGKLKICCLRSPMLDVFKLARLDQLFDIFDDEKSALASF